jgi:hypothetical protein
MGVGGGEYREGAGDGPGVTRYCYGGGARHLALTPPRANGHEPWGPSHGPFEIKDLEFQSLCPNGPRWLFPANDSGAQAGRLAGGLPGPGPAPHLAGGAGRGRRCAGVDRLCQAVPQWITGMGIGTPFEVS